jgi:hypothetical protein
MEAGLSAGMHGAELKRSFVGIDHYHSGTAESAPTGHQTGIGYKTRTLQSNVCYHNEGIESVRRSFFL